MPGQAENYPKMLTEVNRELDWTRRSDSNKVKCVEHDCAQGHGRKPSSAGPIHREQCLTRMAKGVIVTRRTMSYLRCSAWATHGQANERQSEEGSKTPSRQPRSHRGENTPAAGRAASWTNHRVRILHHCVPCESFIDHHQWTRHGSGSL
jgi:hypothetical protein